MHVISWIDELRPKCGPLTDAASLFAAQLGVEHDPPRGVAGLLAVSRALTAHGEHNRDDDERMLVELAGSYLALVLCDSLGGTHAQRSGRHRLDLGDAFFDPFSAVERALAAEDVTRALAHEVARAEAEARGDGPFARVVHEVKRQLKQRDADVTVVDRFDNVLKVQVEGDTVELDLARLIRATDESSSAGMTKAVERFLDAVPSRSVRPSAWAEMRENILPRPIGPRLLAGLPASHALLIEPLAGEAQLGFVLRSERRARYVHEREAHRWDVSSGQIRAAAIENLAQRSERAKLVCTETEHGPIVVAKSGDGLDAARVLLPGLLDVLGPELGVPFAVAIPHRDTLLACPLDAPAALAHLTKTARDQAARAPHAISGAVMQLDRGGVLRVV